MNNQEYYRNITDKIGGPKTEISMSAETAKCVELRIDNGELPNLPENLVQLVRDKANLLIKD